MNNLNTINLCLDQSSLRGNSEIDSSLNTTRVLFELSVKVIQEIGKFCSFHSLNSLYMLYERKVDHINVTNMLKELILDMIRKSRISYTFSAIEDNQSLDDFEKRK